MRKWLKNGSRGALLIAVAVTVTLGSTAAAAEATLTAKKNVAVVSISGYNELLSDIDFIAELAGQPGAAEQVEALLNVFTQGQGLAGLEKSKPWGLVLQTDGSDFLPFAFLPVSDFKQLLDVLATLSIEAEEGDNGVYEVPAGPNTVFVKEQAGWAFIGQTAELLAHLPTNPAKLLDGLHDRYDVSVRLSVQDIPKDKRQMAIDQIRAGVEQGLERRPGEDEDEYELRTKLVEGQIQTLVSAIEDTDHCTLGWTIDADKQKTYLDFNFVALPGSKLVRQSDDCRNITSDFSGFVQPDAAATLNFAGKYPEEDKQQIVSMIEALRGRALKAIEEDSDLPNDADRETAKAALGDILDVLHDTVRAGTMDGGAIVNLDPQALTLAAGGLISDGKRIESALQKLAKVAESQPEFPSVNWDADSHAGVRFHTARVPLPENEEEARKILGDQLDVTVGVDDTRFYVALGKNGLQTLKSVIDRSKDLAGQKVMPMVFSMSLGKILNFASAQDDDRTLAAVAEMLIQSSGKDHLQIVARPIPNGFNYRIEAEQGVLKALGKAAASARQSGL